MGTPTTTIGIDFSLSCPALCKYTGDPNNFSFANCELAFLTGKKGMQTQHMKGRITGIPFRPFHNDTERFLLNAHDIKNWVKPTEQTQIYIEGYSFGSKGSRLYQIGEAAGILKTLLMHDAKGKLINEGRNITAFAPSAIKKFATGKGNADKEQMYEAFEKETGVNLVRELCQHSIASPINDLVDSFWICKMGLSKANN